jgi:hypothetical protein
MGSSVHDGGMSLARMNKKRKDYSAGVSMSARKTGRDHGPLSMRGPVIKIALTLHPELL